MTEKTQEKLENIIDIVITSYIKITDFYRNVKQGIKNFWYYKSVIWNDRWYDHFFLLEVIEIKLQNMVNNWDDCHYENSEVEKAQMEKALTLLNQLKEDDFLDDAMKFMDEKYGELDLNFDDDNLGLFTRGGKIETPEQHEDWKQCYIDANEKKEKVKTEFFELFRNNYEKWWD